MKSPGVFSVFLLLGSVAFPLPAIEDLAREGRLFLPYWSTLADAETTLSINNPQGEPIRIFLDFYLHSGELLGSRHLILEPLQSLDLSVTDLIGKSSFGHLIMRYPAEHHFVPAQVQITGVPDLGPIWLAEGLDEKHLAPGKWVGVIPRLDQPRFSDLQQTTVVFLTNTGDSTHVGELVTEAAGTRLRFPWKVGPKQVKKKILPASTSRILSTQDAYRLSIVTEEGSEDILAMVTTKHENQPPVPVKVSHIAAPQGRERAFEPRDLAGFFWGAKSSLALTNPHPRPLQLALRVHSGAKEFDAYEITLEAERSVLLDLNEIFSIPWLAEGVLRLSYQAGDRPVGYLLNFDENWMTSSLKEPVIDGHLAYSFPLRLGAGLNSRIRLFNPHVDPMDLLLVLSFGEHQYLYPLTSLEGLEFAVADVGSQLLSKVKDSLGRTIPTDATFGQAFIVSTAPEPSLRFLAMGTREDAFTGLATASESCAICPAAALDADIFNPPVRGFVPGTKEVQMAVTWENGLVSLNAPDFVTVDDILVAEGGVSSVTFLTGGTANVTGEIELCLGYTTFEMDGKSLCTCAFHATLFDTEGLVSQNITVQRADLPTNEIVVKLEPGSGSGTLTLRAVGTGTSHVISQTTKAGGTHTESFKRTSIPQGVYNSIEGAWTISPDSGTHQLSYNFSVLPDHRNSCYNTPLETDFGGSLTTVGTTAGPSLCTWGSEDFRTNFLDEVNENGSGRDRFGRDMQIEFFCTGAPASSPCHSANGTCARYRVPTSIRTACGASPTVNHTVAVNSSHADLSCGSRIFIEGLGIRIVQDHGGALSSTQIDNYQGVGTAACSGWANVDRKVFIIP